jgi:MFS family permease
MNASPALPMALSSRLLPMMLALVAATVLAVGSYVVGAFDRAVAPELGKRARLIGFTVRAELQRALDLGGRIDAIGGLERYLDDTLGKFAEVDAIIVRDVDGTMVAAVRRSGSLPPTGDGGEADTHSGVGRGSERMPILDGNRVVGEVQIDTSPTFVRTRLREVFLDVTAIALVAALVAVELTVLVIGVSVTRPLDRVTYLMEAQRRGDFSQRIRRGGMGGLARAADRLNDHSDDLAERWALLSATSRARLATLLDVRIASGRPALLRLSDLSDIRVPLFVFVIATEVAVAFLPVLSLSLARPAWLSAELAAALPLMCYLASAALATPIAGRLCRRFGARRVFLLSIPPTVVSLAALAGATHVAEVALWRGAMAASYTTATIACQVYALGASGEAGSSRPLGAFVAVVYGGVFCGAALGGVVAGRFGFDAALIGGAIVAALAGVAGALLIRGTAGDADRPAPADARPARWKPDARFIALLLGLAVPMSACTAVFVWYLTPLLLTALGSGTSEVARVVMLYYLAAIAFGPAVTAASDGRVGPRILVTAGATLAGLALLSLSVWSGFWAVTVAIIALGIGHTALRSPLYACARRLDPSGASLTPLRLAERVGAILGLVACAVALPALGADAGIRALGLLTIVGAVAHGLTLKFAGGTRPT